MNAGIYAIRNKVNGKQYIGSSVNLFHRWSVHKTYLKQGKHDNRYLQAAWNKYGSDAFEYIILEFCEHYLVREQEYLDKLNPEYNLAKVVGISARLGLKSSFEHKRRQSNANGQFTDEQVMDIIDLIISGQTAMTVAIRFSVLRKVIDSIKHNITYKHVDYTRSIAKNTKSKYQNYEHGSRRKASKLKEMDIPKIRRLRNEGILLKDLAKQFGVSISVISLICRNMAWNHV